ncbi:terminase large subunit [Wohlfahrtiimonas chitiniclastica]|uniref:terminase large subunit n=1 Tax=Wohlfahrtiimonas chitiniclastica TaxID=400946 RepID=UPI001BCD5F16|nr:terminase large subunit [Wohlfahrtiimonas chitiniclastica]MBS7829207.1 terminase large subunit [Wohlfahrtiimonas chitiniclastica]
MKWTTACKDWESRIVNKQSLIPCQPLFPEQSELALRIFKELVLVDVAGSPKIGDVTLDWVFDFVAAIFGAYDAQTGERLINEFFLLISKKNTKSTIAAGIMLTALILNWRNSAELLILAPTKEVADNSFIPTRDMIKADPELQALFNISEHTRTITHRVTNSTLKVVAADTNTVGGKKTSFILIDEVHLFGKINGAESMLREARGGLASRPEGFTIWLTTQSDEQPSGVMASMLNYARAVRDGTIDNPSFLPVLYEFPKEYIEKEKYKDPEYWYITNPNLGVSVSKRYLLTEYEKAKESGEEALRDFFAKHANIEIGLNLRNKRWYGADYWEQQALKVLTLDELIERSEVVTVGGDGGGLDDLLGMAVLGREKKTKKWLLWNHAWCHEKVLEIRANIAEQLRDYENDGDLTIIKRSGDDCNQFGEICGAIYKAGKLDKVGLDPLMIGGLIDGIIDAGVPEDLIVGVSQGYKLAGYTQTTERKLAAGELFHANQRMMAWCVGNARVEVRGNNALITKQSSGKSKIDPLIATFNAVSLMSMNPESKSKMSDFTGKMIMVGI